MGLTWTRTQIPGGAKGDRLKSTAPCTWAWADDLGLILEPRRRLSDSSAFGNNLSHKCNGKCLSTLHRPAMKWFLNMRIARSAALRRCSNPCKVVGCEYKVYLDVQIVGFDLNALCTQYCVISGVKFVVLGIKCFVLSVN